MNDRDRYFLDLYIKKYRYYIAVLVVIFISAVFDIFGFIKDNREYINLETLVGQYIAVKNNSEIGDIERADKIDAFENDATGVYVYYSGKVDKITKYRDDYRIRLETSMWMDIICEVDGDMKNSIYSLKINEPVSIRGYFNKIFITWDVENCEIIMDNTKEDIRD